MTALFAEGQDQDRVEGALAQAANLAGIFLPHPRGATGYVERRARDDILAQPLAARLPPNALRHYYGFRDGRYHDHLYLQSGRADTDAIRRILTQDGVALAGARMLDFGCSSGRLIRHFEAEAAQGEIWGVDIHAEAIAWAKAHLSPPFHFATTTTAPHLPFEDGGFDVIIAGSVFTHLAEMADAWLLELRRILRPAGRLYLTFSDEGTLAEIARTRPDHPSNGHIADLAQEVGFDPADPHADWRALVTRRGPWATRVVYRRADFAAHLARWFDLRAIVPMAYGWQSAALLAKRAAP